MKTGKRILSGVITLSMGLQTLFSVGVAANTQLTEVTNIDRSVDEICVCFNSDTVANASVLSADMSQTNVETKTEGRKLFVSTDELSNGTYYLKVEAENLLKMYSFEVNKMSDEYVVYGKNKSANRPQTPVIRNDWMFMTPYDDASDAAVNSGTYTWTDENQQEQSVIYAKRSSFMYNKNYTSYQEADSGIEFDFKDMNTSNQKSGLYSAFRVLFNASENTGTPDTWTIYAQSNQGAYILSLTSASNTRLDAYLHKWNGAVDKKIQPGNTNLTKSSNSIKLAEKIGAIDNYSVGKEYRFKIASKQVGEDVHITVYAAEYTEGVIGDWFEIFNYTDALTEGDENTQANTPIPAGTVWFYTDGSYNVGNGYFTSYYTKDLSVGDISISEMELTAPVVEKVSGNDKIKIEFNEAIDESSLSGNIIVYDASGDDTYCEAYLDENDHSKVYVDLSMLNSGNDYHLYIGKGLKSAMGLNLERQYDYLFDYSYIYDEFVGDETAQKWYYTRWRSSDANVFTYDGGMFLGGSDPSTTTHTIDFTNILNSDESVSYSKTIPMNNQNTVIYRNDYMNYAGDNASLEFDYKSYGYTACYDESGNKYYYVSDSENKYGYTNGTYENTRVYFNGENFVVDNDNSRLTSDNGSYILQINNYGKSVSLRKWDGTELAFGSMSATSVGTELVKVDSIPGYKEENAVRYRVETENIDTGVLINVYIAYYDEYGSRGEWTNIISYLDTETDAKKSGSFCFSSTTSNKAEYGYINSTLIDNVWHANIDLVSLDEVLNKLKERIDTVYNSENWDNYKDEILAINEEVEAYKKITGMFDEEYSIKLSALLSGKSNEEISRELYNKLSQKDSLKFVFIGGSLTQGGADYQETFKTYMSEKTGVAAENISVINVGNGGQGSAWHQVRLYDEVMAENPDMVIIDYCGNDDGYYAESSAYADGTHKSALALEVTFRRLLKMEDAPAIMVNMIPAKDRIIKTGLLNKGIKAYSNGTKIVDINIPAYTLGIPVCTYYNVPVMNLTDEFIKYTQLKYKDELNEWNADIPTAYYHKENKVYVQCEQTDDNAVLGTPLKESDIEVFVDYEGINTHYGKTYNFNTTEYGNIWRALSKDETHPSSGYDGYKLYGDMMVELMDTESSAAPRIQRMADEPIIKLTDIYDEFNMTKKQLSVANINSLDCYSVSLREGGSYQDIERFTSTNGRTVSGVTFTGPMTFTYRFEGNVFYAVNSTLSILTKYATIDGKAYISTGRYYNNTMLTNSDEHIFKLELPAGESISISGFFVDEDTLLNNFKKSGKYTMVDMSTVANVYGAYRSGDGVVYGSEDAAFKAGADADIEIYYKENNWSNISPNADKIYEYFTSADYNGTPFNVENLKNERYRALTVDAELVQIKWNNWSLPSTVDTNGAMLKIPTVDVPDDFYSNIHMLINNNNTGSTVPKVVLQVNFSDGTSEDISFDSLNTITEDSVGVKQVMNETAVNHNNATAAGSFVINEYTVSLPTEKRISSIGFKYETSSYYRVYAMTLEKVYDAGLLDVEFEYNGNYVNDISQYAMMPLTVKAKLDNRTNGVLYFAFYNEGKLVKVNSFNVNTTASDKYENIVKNNIIVPEMFDSVSAYLWSADGTMKPLTVGIEK